MRGAPSVIGCAVAGRTRHVCSVALVLFRLANLTLSLSRQTSNLGLKELLVIYGVWTSAQLESCGDRSPPRQSGRLYPILGEPAHGRRYGFLS
jgi:hypothetical protein